MLAFNGLIEVLKHLVLKSALVKNFKEVHVDVVDCPDLLQKPWSLAAPGEYYPSDSCTFVQAGFQ
jgi:hypothetical protein